MLNDKKERKLFSPITIYKIFFSLQYLIGSLKEHYFQLKFTRKSLNDFKENKINC